MSARVDSLRIVHWKDHPDGSAAGAEASKIASGPQKRTSRKPPSAPRPDPYMPTWPGMAYVAFVINAYAERILTWRAATSMRTALVLDIIERGLAGPKRRSTSTAQSSDRQISAGVG